MWQYTQRCNQNCTYMSTSLHQFLTISTTEFCHFTLSYPTHCVVLLEVVARLVRERGLWRGCGPSTDGWRGWPLERLLRHGLPAGGHRIDGSGADPALQFLRSLLRRLLLLLDQSREHRVKGQTAILIKTVGQLLYKTGGTKVKSQFLYSSL